MQQRRKTLTAIITLTACAMLGLSPFARAEEKKADPAGTWTWSVPARGGGPDRTNTLKLKIEGDKLTGKLSAPGRNGQASETEITDAKVSGDEVGFTVTREFNGNKIVSKYSGKVAGDTIKGKVEIDRNGDVLSRDWEAHREAEKAEKPEKSEKSDKM